MGDLSDKDYGFMSVVAEARGAYRKWNEAEEECIRLRAEVERLKGLQGSGTITVSAELLLEQVKRLRAGRVDTVCEILTRLSEAARTANEGVK